MKSIPAFIRGQTPARTVGEPARPLRVFSDRWPGNVLEDLISPNPPRGSFRREARSIMCHSANTGVQEKSPLRGEAKGLLDDLP
jgi:hypothetical protein